MIDGSIIGIIAGILGVSGFIYQTVKYPFGMTYPMLFFVGISISLWAGYGLYIEDPIMYFPNIFIVCMIIFITILKYKSRISLA